MQESRYFTASIKNIQETEVGDTVTGADRPTEKPLSGFKKAIPMVFAGIYPADGAKYGFEGRA
jgi:GTP-binding protein LepA